MMVGRFVGAFLMRSIPAETVLAWFSVGAFVVMIVTVFATGPLAMWCADPRSACSTRSCSRRSSRSASRASAR